ncbi:MAG: hypothetical protein OXH38_07055 [Chloroflexi bacterium]|nr:hypothetical protein [Chloroflexota bacterium]
MGTFERDQLMLLRRFVRDKIYEQAALQPVPELIDNVRRRYAIAERERITASGDLDALEELHQEEIAEKDETIGSLRESLTRRDSAFVELQDKLDQKQAKLAHLQYQLGQAKGEPGADDRVEEATESRLPATVAEAIEISKNRFPALRFGPQSMDKLESLNPQAGPPRKILGDLDTLNQLSQLLKGDSKLGQDVISWLKAQNVNVSRESSTRLNKYAAELTFPTVRGTYEQMGHHIKYGGGLGKDIEARIHFSVHLSDDEDGVTIDVGYVGPKIMPD